MEEAFDVSKDYYSILGVKRDVTADELKIAYRKLAFEYHPDTSINPEQSSERFKLVSEAWAVLSKSDIRSRYDFERRGVISSSQDSMYTEYVDTTSITQGFQTQKANYAKVQSRSSAWGEVREKYRTEKWQNMSLKDKKIHRSQQLHTSGSLIMKVVPVVFAGILVYQLVKRT